LVELHEKLWGKKELEEQIIRTVALDAADFTHLQSHLDDLNPTRGSDQYKFEDVLGVKMEFLRSKANSTSSDFPQQTVWNRNLTDSSGSAISPSILASDEDVDDLANLPEIEVEGDEQRECSRFTNKIICIPLSQCRL
jgi:hypothetical protein